MESAAVQYAPVMAACPCGCNSYAWFVCGSHGWRSQHSSNIVAAHLAANMLNSGRITQDEIDVMWSSDKDWDEVMVLADDVAVIPPHLH